MKPKITDVCDGRNFCVVCEFLPAWYRVKIGNPMGFMILAVCEKCAAIDEAAIEEIMENKVLAKREATASGR